MRYVNKSDVAATKSNEYRSYINHFADVHESLNSIASQYGVPLETRQEAKSRAATNKDLRRKLASLDANFRNDGKSIVYGTPSPACIRCRTGERSISTFISLACNRSCWFCFNRNQYDWEEYRSSRKDWRNVLDSFKQTMGDLDYIALTGGEPLLFPEETIEFFDYARTENPRAHLRLYTSGDGLDDALLNKLAASDLDEIRFSVKLDDSPDALQHQRSLIESAVGVIPHVMVEMPVIPGTYEQMRELLSWLADIGAFGINLLEFCFPLHNSSAYTKRGLKIARNPYRIPYDYEYAGALPVAGSEELALRLMSESIEENNGGSGNSKTDFSLHYCSLENKNTAQIFKQNMQGQLTVPYYRFSSRTFFYETVRAFNKAAKQVQSALDKANMSELYTFDPEGKMIMFDPAALISLSEAENVPPLFLASAVVDADDQGRKRFREVGLQIIGREDFGSIVGTPGTDD